MVGCNAWSQEYCIGQMECPVNRDDFEDMRCLIGGLGFSFGLAHGKHDSFSLKTPIYMVLQFKHYLISSCFACLMLFFQVAFSLLLLIYLEEQYPALKNLVVKTKQASQLLKFGVTRMHSPVSMKFMLYCLHS